MRNVMNARSNDRIQHPKMNADKHQLIKPTGIGSGRPSPKCARCRNHNEIVRRKGHKDRCPWAECICDKCQMTAIRRVYAIGRQKAARQMQALSSQTQKDAELLLNLKMESGQRKRRHDDEGAGTTAGRFAGHPLPYRFSGSIQNNTFFPVPIRDSISPPHTSSVSLSPPSQRSGTSSSEVDSTTVEVHDSPPGEPGGPTSWEEPASFPQPCSPLCPFNQVPLVYPSSHLGYPSGSDEYGQFFPHPMVNPWFSPIPPCPMNDEMLPQPADAQFEPGNSMQCPPPYQDPGMLLHPGAPFASARYPFDASLMSRHMTHFRGAPM